MQLYRNRYCSRDRRDRETTGESWDHLIRLTDGLMITEPGASTRHLSRQSSTGASFFVAPEIFWGRNSKHMAGKHYERGNDIMRPSQA